MNGYEGDELYDDIYGDEIGSSGKDALADDAELILAEDEPRAQGNNEAAGGATEVVSPSASSSLPAKPAQATLPSKPQPSTSTSTSTSNAAASSEQQQLSYSAQIAQQFSSYSQTPSQERQRRPGLPVTQLRAPSKLAGQNPNLQQRQGGSGNAGVGVGGDGFPQESVFGKKPSEMHDAGKIFVGGLSWDTTDEGLRDYFSEFGKVDAVTIMRDANGTSRGYAFLTFEDPSVMDVVLGREHILDGKQIDAKRAVPREEHLRNTRYFVGGLSPNTTSESMREFFGQYGLVVDATVMVDRQSGRSKGFGFVTFPDAGASSLLVGKTLVLDDKQIEVKMAQPRSHRDQARSAPTNANNNAGFQTKAQPSTPSLSLPTQFPQTPMQPSMMMPHMPPNPMFGGAPMMAGGMGGMGFPPFNMPGMNMGMFPMGMGGMSGMNGMGQMNNLRMGMGPMAASAAAAAAAGMNGMNARPKAGNGVVYGQRMGQGPLRMSNRGQNSFHPYSR